MKITRKSVCEAIAEGTWKSVPLTDGEMFKLYEIDPKIWEIEKRIINQWGKQFQTKLWLKRIEGAFECTTAVDLLETWERSKPIDRVIPVRDLADNRLLEIFLTDCHFDKLAWAQESGDNYDIKIARSIFLDAVSTLLDRAKPLGFSKILFPIGSDLFNSEGKRATTTKGTPQTADCRWQKSFDFVATTVREAIELCAEHAPVDVLVIPGNHDYERSYYLGAVIAAWFETDPMIHVDNGPKSRKYYKFGTNLIMFDHGEIKPTEYGMIMASECTKEWAKTTKRFVHLGHMHKRQKFVELVDEKYGVEVERFPSFVGTCGWHFDNGYIGNQKRALAKIYDAKGGPMYDITYNIPKSFYRKK